MSDFFGWVAENEATIALVIAVVAFLYAARVSRQVAKYDGPELVLQGFAPERARTYYYVQNVGNSAALNIKAQLVTPFWPLKRERVKLDAVPPLSPKSKALGKGQTLTFDLPGGEAAFDKLLETQCVHVYVTYRDKAGRRYRHKYVPSVRMGRVDEGDHYYDS